MKKIGTKALMRRVGSICLAVFLAWAAPGAVVTAWNGTGDWHGDAANWSQGVPGDGDEAVVASGSVALSQSSSELASFTLTGGTLTFTNWSTRLNATNVTVSGGTITHVQNLVTTTNIYGAWERLARVWIACSDFVFTGGTVNVDGKGYPGQISKSGCGPGGGWEHYNAGAAHGGAGGYGFYEYGSERRTDIYGDPAYPEDPGSGGGTSGVSPRRGGDGGGVVRIDASGAVTISKTISANALAATGNYGAGGSGGSILVNCHTIKGTGGSLQAKGGNDAKGGSGGGGGGGGGRIALHYDSAAQAALSEQPRISFLLHYGIGYYGSSHNGDIGTLFLPDTTLLRDDLSNIYAQIVGVREWTTSSLAVSNTTVRFIEEGVRLNVGGNLTVSGTAGKLSFGNLYYENDRWQARGDNGPIVNVGGDLRVSNGGALSFLAALTNAQDNVWGGRLEVGGALNVSGNNAVLELYAHRTNGTAMYVSAAALTVDSGGTIDAAGKGYAGRLTGNQKKVRGLGPAAGTAGTGGAHGGATVDGTYGSGGQQPYGSVEMPVTSGSAGGEYWDYGGFGGGAVRLDINGPVCVNGVITANATAGSGSYSGGGAGGSVYITCATFAGTNGVVRAEGGVGGTEAGYTTGGGGGRIAVHYNTALQAAMPVPTVSFRVAGGWNALGYGELGTLYFSDNRFLAENLLHSGEWRVPGTESWSVSNLVMSNRWFRFPHPGFRLNVANDMAICGTTPNLHRLELVGGAVDCGGRVTANNANLFLRAATNATLMACGSMVVTNGGRLEVFASPTNTLAPGFTAEVAVRGVMNIYTSSWVYPWSDAVTGGSPVFRVGGLNVAAGGGFNANVRGWRGTTGNGYWGRGDGGGYDYSGAGYGGAGGKTGSNANGQPYGSAASPDLPGSNGGWHATHASGSNGGGGLIRLEAPGGTVRLFGSLTANGGSMGSKTYSGAGSGGGVYILCRRLYGDTQIKARGGNGGSDNGSGGGGGRIAVWLVKNYSTVSLDAGGGSKDGTGQDGQNGSADFYYLPEAGTALLLK